jgi:hypothetical protein
MSAMGAIGVMPCQPSDTRQSFDSKRRAFDTVYKGDDDRKSPSDGASNFEVHLARFLQKQNRTRGQWVT